MSSEDRPKHLALVRNTGAYLNAAGAVVLPPGRYNVTYQNHVTTRMYGAWKAIVTLAIDGYGVSVDRYYNVRCDRRGKITGWPTGLSGQFQRDMIAIFGATITDLTSLASVGLSARLITVRRDVHHDELPSSLRYSKAVSLRLR